MSRPREWSELGLKLTQPEPDSRWVSARTRAKTFVLEEQRFNAEVLGATRHDVPAWEQLRAQQVAALTPAAVTSQIDPEWGRVMLCGDWHGNTVHAVAAIHLAEMHGCDAIIQLGDFGVWPGYEGQLFLDVVAAAAGNLHVPVAFIDGNHEDFTQLYRAPLVDGTRTLRQGVFHLSRGHRFELMDRSWAALGGAFSIDQQWRTEWLDWWAAEAITGADVERLGGGKVDVLLTHDAPSAYRHAGPRLPVDIERAADLHRKWIDLAVERTRAELLFHGHFHRFHRSVSEGLTMFGLDMDGRGTEAFMIVERE